jgi:probable F420-dependent oxidoreductase
MRIGVVFPQTEIGADPAVIHDYSQAAEGLGYTHILAYDHVLGASTEHRPEWRGPYTDKTTFHEPFVLFGYLAATTWLVELVTGVIILPQRQTALVAKQAAEVDVLSGGRLRLGVGVGWNPVEYEALGENFHDRGRREEEQIELLRLLWTEPVVTFKGKWHTVTEAGINPLPVQRPIPLWLGGHSDAALERAGRLADGWLPQMPAGDKAREAVDKLRKAAHDAGRDPSAIGIEARLNLREGNRETWQAALDWWREIGATHASINTMGMGLSAREHIRAIEQFKRGVGI